MNVTNTTFVYSSLGTEYTFNDLTTDNAPSTVRIESTTSEAHSTDIVLQTLRLGTSEDVILYASLIGGILGLVFVVAVVCWILEQSEHISDPIGGNIQNILGRSRSEISKGSDAPQAVIPTNSEDLPGWMKPTPVTEPIATQMPTPVNHYEENDDDPLYESYNEEMHNELKRQRSYGYVNPIVTTENRYLSASIKEVPSAQQDVKPVSSLVQEMKKRFQATNESRRTRRQSTVKQPNTYETAIDSVEDAYNQSLYSNDEIPPEIPKRDPV